MPAPEITYGYRRRKLNNTRSRHEIWLELPHYYRKDLTRLELILKGNKLGFTLYETRTLIAAVASEADTITELLPSAKIEAQIAQLEEQLSSLAAALDELYEAIEQSGANRESA